MAEYLKNLKVNKVSFVGSPANKREFLLLKSTEGNQHTNNQSVGGTIPMRDIVKTKLTDLVKTGHDPDKVIEVLKSDESVKLQDDEVQEIQNFLDITSVVSTQKQADADSDVLKKRAEAAEATNKSLGARLLMLEDTQHRDEIRAWVVKECAFVPHSVDSIVDTIIKMERIDGDAGKSAEEFKESLQKSSAAIEQSKALSETGSSRDTINKDLGTTDIISKVTKELAELRKSEGKPTTAAALEDIIKGQGGHNYITYMEAHRARSRTGGLVQ